MILLLFFFIFSSFSSSKLILPPPRISSPTIALLFIQGASLNPDQYTSLLSKLQTTSSNSIWVGISDFPLNLPDPLTISSMISSLLTEMKAKGMPKPAKTFYVGHSLGGIVLASHLSDVQVDGVILLGSFLNRSIRTVKPDGTSHLNFLSPTLTIGNELDGQCRITRIAEQFYHSVLNIEKESIGKFPVAVVKGASHMQFASGNVPTFVKENDLKPEISEAEAHTRISLIMAYFIDGNAASLNKIVAASSDFLLPLINAMKLEGSYHLNTPCYDNDLVNRNVKDCGHGSKWVEYAQSVMSGFSEYNIKNVNLKSDDNFHRVYSVLPVHLPTCLNTCQNNAASVCELDCITVTEINYEPTDDFDAGLFPVTAFEMKSKMNSRQRMLEHVKITADFHVTDEINTCSAINKLAYDYALSHTNPQTLERFRTFGEKMEFGDDEGPFNAGPLWIWKSLDHIEKTYPNGEYYTEVDSPMMRTPNDYSISAASGFHYCKLLSPARAIEWIYLDGLKRKLSLNR